MGEHRMKEGCSKRIPDVSETTFEHFPQGAVLLENGCLLKNSLQIQHAGGFSGKNSPYDLIFYSLM